MAPKKCDACIGLGKKEIAIANSIKHDDIQAFSSPTTMNSLITDMNTYFESGISKLLNGLENCKKKMNQFK